MTEGPPAKKVAKKASPPPLPRVRRAEDGVLEYPIFEYTVLYADGSTGKVIATHDDSSLRELLHKETGQRIIGLSEGNHVGWLPAVLTVP
ncbi:MAG TPA: hypothetical protein VH482_17350 [Thermomicrobiales bacterium]|jgi:hypothetical protein